jgi:Rieske 2Fe-2S family protein
MPVDAQAVLVPTLEGGSYTDPAVFAAECERIFEQQWYYAGRADEIPAPGRFIRRRVGRETVLLVRGKDQVIRGFLNVCRHRVIGRQVVVGRHCRGWWIGRCGQAAWAGRQSSAAAPADS